MILSPSKYRVRHDESWGTFPYLWQDSAGRLVYAKYGVKGKAFPADRFTGKVLMNCTGILVNGTHEGAPGHILVNFKTCTKRNLVLLAEDGLEEFHEVLVLEDASLAEA